MQIKPSRLGVSLNWDYKGFNHIDKVDKNYKFYLYNDYIRSLWARFYLYQEVGVFYSHMRMEEDVSGRATLYVYYHDWLRWSKFFKRRLIKFNGLRRRYRSGIVREYSKNNIKRSIKEKINFDLQNLLKKNYRLRLYLKRKLRRNKRKKNKYLLQAESIVLKNVVRVKPVKKCRLLRRHFSVQSVQKLGKAFTLGKYFRKLFFGLRYTLIRYKKKGVVVQYDRHKGYKGRRKFSDVRLFAKSLYKSKLQRLSEVQLKAKGLRRSTHGVRNYSTNFDFKNFDFDVGFGYKPKSKFHHYNNSFKKRKNYKQYNDNYNYQANTNSMENYKNNYKFGQKYFYNKEYNNFKSSEMHNKKNSFGLFSGISGRFFRGKKGRSFFFRPRLTVGQDRYKQRIRFKRSCMLKLKFKLLKVFSAKTFKKDQKFDSRGVLKDFVRLAYRGCEQGVYKRYKLYIAKKLGALSSRKIILLYYLINNKKKRGKARKLALNVLRNKLFGSMFKTIKGKQVKTFNSKVLKLLVTTLYAFSTRFSIKRSSGFLYSFLKTICNYFYQSFGRVLTNRLLSKRPLKIKWKRKFLVFFIKTLGEYLPISKSLRLTYLREFNRVVSPVKLFKFKNWCMSFCRVRRVASLMRLSVKKRLFNIFMHMRISALEFFGTDVAIQFVPLEFGAITADMLAKYISYRLSLGVSLRSIFRLIRREVMRYRSYIRGYKILCVGRFTRAPRASSKKSLLGNIGKTTIKSNLDIGMSSVILKYGTCGIKVWLNKFAHKEKKAYNFSLTNTLGLVEEKRYNNIIGVGYTQNLVSVVPKIRRFRGIRGTSVM